MRSGGQENFSRRAKRDLRLASIVGLLLAGLGIGVAQIGEATAFDRANQFRAAVRKSGPPGRSFAPFQRRLPANPVAIQKGASGPAVADKNTVTHTDHADKAPLGRTGLERTGLGKSATGEMPLGKGLSNHGGKGFGKDLGGQLGGHLGGQAGFPKGPVGESGFGKSALGKSSAERRTLILAHRQEIFTSRLRLPYRPLPGERGFTGVPPQGETRFVPNELVLHVDSAISPQTLDAAMRRHGLTTVESQRMELTGGTLLRLRYGDSREMSDVVRALERENIGVAQPDYVYSVQQDSAIAGKNGSSPGGFNQYIVAKLRLDEAHRVATGAKVLVAVIDSKIDAAHPDLSGALAGEFDTIGVIAQVVPPAAGRESTRMCGKLTR